MDHYQSRLFKLTCALLALWGGAQAFAAPADVVLPATSLEFGTSRLWHPEFALWKDRPRAATLAVGLPNPLGLSLGVVHGRGLRSQLSAGVSPIPLGSAGVYIATNFEALVAYHPGWEQDGAFFVASGVGYQSLNLNMAIRLGSLLSDLATPNGALGWQNFYWVATVGWNWLKVSGFFVGVDLSVRVPIIGWGGVIASSTDTSFNQSLYNSSVNSFSRYARLVYPSVTLIRLGWVF